VESWSTQPSQPPVHVFVDNHVEGGVATFLRTLLPRLASRIPDLSLTVNASYPGLEDLNGLSDRGVRVEELTSIYGASWFTGLGKQREAGRRRLHNLLVWICEYLFLFPESMRLRWRYRRLTGRRVLIVNGGYPGSPLARSLALALASRNEVFMNIHGLATASRPVARYVDRLVDRLVAREVELFVCVSDTCRQALDSRFVGLDSHSVTILNAVDSNASLSLVRHQRTKSRRSVLVKRIGLIGTLHESKGHFFALDVLATLHRRHPNLNFELVFYGPDPYGIREHLERRAAQLAVGALLDFRGFETDPSVIYSDLDVVIVPSLVPESFSLVGVEAVSAGLAVVASNAGALPEILEQFSNATILDVHDPSSWATTVFTSLSNVSEVPDAPAQENHRLFDADAMTNDYADLLLGGMKK
jgi:glycosyltransferase involved in cell wall biosynthesis